jgi:hypothetical protein
MARIGTTFTESLVGFFEIGWGILTPYLRSRRLRWGALEDERGNSYPGDPLVPAPKWMANHAISIDASPEQVWPWIAQIGQGRGGFYSYQKLENLAGCQIVNTARILEEHQQIRVGDPIRIHVEAPPMSAAIVDAPNALVLFGNPAESDASTTLSTTWGFLLLEQPDGTTRLLSRTRYHYADNLRSRLMGGPLLIEPISFVMERKMLRVIKSLAESPQP